MTREAIRSLIYSAMVRCRFLMDRGFIPVDLNKYAALGRLQTKFDFISNTSALVHYRWLLKMHDDVIAVMPSASSRFQPMRRKLIDLLDEAEKNINREMYRIVIPLAG